MSDTQIAALASSAIPKVYDVPESVQFLLKAVQASFDGSGAAGTFLPCVAILSDSGHVIARAIDTAVSVAAGGSAEVSFFPHVKHAAAASGSGAPDYLILQGAGQNVLRPPSGDSDHGKFTYATRRTNDDASWTYILDGAGDVKEVDTTVAGRYFSFCQFEWSAPGAAIRLAVAINTFGTGFSGTSPFVQETTTTVWAATVEAFDYLTSGTGKLTVEPSIGPGAATLGFVADYWVILRYPT